MSTFQNGESIFPCPRSAFPLRKALVPTAEIPTVPPEFEALQIREGKAGLLSTRRAGSEASEQGLEEQHTLDFVIVNHPTSFLPHQLEPSHYVCRVSARP